MSPEVAVFSMNAQRSIETTWSEGLPPTTATAPPAPPAPEPLWGPPAVLPMSSVSRS